MDDPNVRTVLSTALTLLLLLAAVGGGWLVTNRMTDANVGSASSYGACLTEDRSSARVACVSDALLAEADRAAAGMTGGRRATAIATFVRDRERAASEDETLASICHPAMHDLGRQEGRTAARTNSAPVFPVGSSQLCTAGYVHGLAEGYLVGSTDADVLAVFPQLCHDPDAREGCAHGIGHALLQAREAQRPVVAAASASVACGELPGEFPTNCRNGVYMELAIRTDPVVTVDRFTDACRSIEAVDDRLTCWGYLSSSVATNDLPLDRVPAACGRADLPGQFPCIEQYGRDLGPDRVAECQDSSKTFEVRARCVSGALGVHVGSGHVSSAEARDACGEIAEDELRGRCTAAVARYARGRAEVESQA